jgi:hypothetical protein
MKSKQFIIKATEIPASCPLPRSRTASSAPASIPESSMPDFSESVQKCCNCERCTPIGKRRKCDSIRDGRFDTKEDCCSTRRHGKECPRVLAMERQFKQEQHDSRIRTEEREKVLNKEITALSNQIGALHNLEPETGSENEIEIRVLSRWKLRLQESLRTPKEQADRNLFTRETPQEIASEVARRKKGCFNLGKSLRTKEQP